MAPRPRLSPDPSRAGYFFPREVADILGVPEIDYRQLRALFKLARLQAGDPVLPADHRWSRYTLRDVAAVQEALRLAGGSVALRPGRRLRLRPVESAVIGLMRMGVRDPLLEVPLERYGSTIVATIGGDLLDPTSGQLTIRRVFAQVRPRIDPGEYDLLVELRAERDRKLQQMRRQVAAVAELA